MKKYIQKISVVAVFALVFAVAPHVHAAFNTLGNDCPTVMISSSSNDTTGNKCWAGSVSAHAGDTINVRIYYHNTDVNAANAVVHLNSPSAGTQSSFTFNGFLNNTNNGSATVNLASPATLTLNHVYWYADKSSLSALPGGQSESALFGGSGLNLGSIPGVNTCPSTDGFCHSGSVVASFIVGGNPITSTCSISSFTINGSQTVSTIPYGTTGTLAWTTPNCTSVTVNGVTYTGAQATSGSIQTPAITTPQTFTLVANGVSRSVTATPGARTSACLVSNFTINGSSSVATITYGTTGTLAWTTANCGTVTVNGVIYSGAQADSNSISTPVITTPQSFTLIAGGITRTVTANPTAQTTNPCIANTFTANGVSGSLSVSQNTSVSLAWTTTNCTSATVNNVTYTNGQQNSGSVSIGTPTVGTYPYTLFAVDNTGHTSQLNVTITVTGGIVNNNCQITYFQPTQNSVVSGNSTSLNWTLSSGCTGPATLSGTNYPSAQVYGTSVTTGPIYTYSTYTLTAYGTNGISTQATTYVSVNSIINNNNTCYISSFTVNGMSTAQVVSGGTATIAWNTYGCSSVTVSGPGIYSQSFQGNQQTSVVYNSATYTITANTYGSFYGSPVTQTVYVTTTQPYIVSTNMNPITTIATNVSANSARLNGLVPVNQTYGSVNAYFEYGTSPSFGRQTNPQVVSTYTLLNYFDTIFTSPNTTYYYRAVMNSNGVITTGETVSFTTPGFNTNTNTNTTTNTTFVNTTVRGTGTGSAFASIVISDQSQNVLAGDILNYTITYKNISSSTLSNAMINVVLPNGVTYKGSSQGMPTTNNTIVITLGSLAAGATGFVNVQAVVDSSVVAGNNLLATATLTFGTPSGAQDTAIAYYLNTVGSTNSNNLAGFAFGAGFFPTTFLGWILLLGIIIIIILVARHYSILSRNAQNGKVTTDVHDMHSTSTH